MLGGPLHVGVHLQSRALVGTDGGGGWGGALKMVTDPL